jgi:signal transduction histidine kinase
MVRHSKATEGLVEINYQEDGGMSVTIEDNGVGLTQSGGSGDFAGIGLRNVEQRVKAIDGKLDLKSTPGAGTSFFLEFEPLKEKGN